MEQREVSLPTAQGSPVPGTLTLPQAAADPPPAVLLLRPDADDARARHAALAQAIGQRGVAALSLSAGDPETVRSGVRLLDDQTGVDPSRLGVVAEGDGADAALQAWAGDPRMQAMVLVAGRLDAESRLCLERDPWLALRLFASSEDKRSFCDMADAYFTSTNADTDIHVSEGLGAERLDGTGNEVADWIAARVLSGGLLSEVQFQTEDGWTIHANYRRPQATPATSPAVILLPTSQTDRFAYHALEVALCRSGIAVLNVDWRGRGRSTGRGRYAALEEAERKRAYLDALAGAGFLASRPEIDASRIGIAGAAVGGQHAIEAAMREPRIRTAVLLTGYYPSQEDAERVAQYPRPVLYVATRGMKPVAEAMRALYERTREHGSAFWLYAGGGVGYELFDQDPQLPARIVGWMQEKLSP